MNRRERRAAGRGLPKGLRVWTQVVRCADCGYSVIHVEASPWGDEPYGLPAATCDCGGEMLAPRRDLEAVGEWVH